MSDVRTCQTSQGPASSSHVMPPRAVPVCSEMLCIVLTAPCVRPGHSPALHHQGWSMSVASSGDTAAHCSARCDGACGRVVRWNDFLKFAQRLMADLFEQRKGHVFCFTREPLLCRPHTTCKVSRLRLRLGNWSRNEKHSNDMPQVIGRQRLSHMQNEINVRLLGREYLSMWRFRILCFIYV